jgi:hypothetical protein
MSSVGTVTTLHKWHHDDYDEAKRDIHQQLGNISEVEMFGRQVLVALYIRPIWDTKTRLQMSSEKQQEDIYQGKVCMIVSMGPDAFRGDESYMSAMFGRRPPPAVGDWVFLRAEDGTPTSLKGDDAIRVKWTAPNGDTYDLYSFDGWPCRYISDESVIGRIRSPHTVV